MDTLTCLRQPDEVKTLSRVRVWARQKWGKYHSSIHQASYKENGLPFCRTKGSRERWNLNLMAQRPNPTKREKNVKRAFLSNGGKNVWWVERSTLALVWRNPSRRLFEKGRVWCVMPETLNESGMMRWLPSLRDSGGWN